MSRGDIMQKHFHADLEDKLNDVSLYGEFIATFHNWVSSEEQKSKVQHLQEIGREEPRS